MSVIRMLRNVAIALAALVGFAALPAFSAAAGGSAASSAIPAAGQCCPPQHCEQGICQVCCNPEHYPICFCQNGDPICGCGPLPPPG